LGSVWPLIINRLHIPFPLGRFTIKPIERAIVERDIPVLAAPGCRRPPLAGNFPRTSAARYISLYARRHHRFRSASGLGALSRHAPEWANLSGCWPLRRAVKRGVGAPGEARGESGPPLMRAVADSRLAIGPALDALHHAESCRAPRAPSR
jgi:hypothetical protein